MAGATWLRSETEIQKLTRSVCEADGTAGAAARLLGAAGARSDRQGRILSSELNGCCDRLVQTLGPDAFAEQEATGRSMSVGEALSFALGELDASRSPVPR